MIIPSNCCRSCQNLPRTKPGKTAESFAAFLREGGKGKVVPTRDGMEFYASLDEVFGAFVKLRGAAKDIRNDQSRHLKITATPALSMSIVPDIMDKMLDRFPDAKLEYLIVDMPRFFSTLHTATTDIAFGAHMGEQPGVEHIDLGPVTFVCAVPQHHPLAQKDIIDVSDLKGETFISLREDENVIFHEHTQLIDNSGVEFTRNFFTQSSACAYSMVRKGRGVAVLEPFSAKFWHQNGVVIKPFSPTIRYPFKLFVRAGILNQPIVREVISLAKKEFAAYREFVLK